MCGMLILCTVHGCVFHAGYTFLDVIHGPFWDALTNMLPMWLAPNLITLSGLMGVIISYFVSAYYIPDFVGGEWIARDRAPGTVQEAIVLAAQH